MITGNPLECFFDIESRIPRLKSTNGIQYPTLTIHTRISVKYVPLDSSTHYLAFYNQAVLPDPLSLPGREAVCTIFITVFDITWPGANPRHTTWVAGMLNTKPSWCGHYFALVFCLAGKTCAQHYKLNQDLGIGWTE